MEFNPFKWFDRNKEYKEALRSPKYSIGVEVPEDVDIKALNEKIEGWRKKAKELGKEKGLAEREIAQLSDEIYALLGKTSEAEVLLANISIDLEVSRRAGKFDEIAYKGYGKLSEINVFNTILKGKTPEEMNKSLAWCYKTAAKSLSVKTLLCSAIVVGGGIVGSAIGVPLLAAAVATTAGAVAGWHLGRTLSRHSSEKKFNETMEKLNELVSEKSGTENLSPEEVEHYTQELLKGGHRFGKKLGVDAGGRIDTESVPAQLLIRFSKLMQSRAQESELFPATQKEEQVANRVAQFTELYNELLAINRNVHISKQEGETAKSQYASLQFFLNNYQEELNKDEYQEFRHNVVSDLLEKLKIIIKWAGLDETATQEELDKRTNELTQYINDIDIQIEEAYNRRVIMERGGAMNAMFRALRADQNKEKMHGVVGALTGALFSNLIRGAIAVGLKGQTVAEFVRSQLSITGPWLDQHFLPGGVPEKVQWSGDAISEAWVQKHGLPRPGTKAVFYSQQWLDEWTKNHGGAKPEFPQGTSQYSVEGSYPRVPIVKDSTHESVATKEGDPSYYSAKPSAPAVTPAGEQTATESAAQAEPAVPSDGEQPIVKAPSAQGEQGEDNVPGAVEHGEAAPEMISVSQAGLENKLGKDFYIFESGGYTIIEGHIGGKGLLHVTSHHDQALRVLLSRVYGDGLAQKYGGTIPTHALDAIENVIQNLKNPALVEKIVGEKGDLLSINPDAKTVRLVYNIDALNKLIRHGLEVATHDAGGTNTSHDLWEKRLVHPVEDFKAEESKGSAVSEGGEEKRAGVASERVKGISQDDIPKIGSKEHIALERAGKVITDETIDRVPGIHPRPPTIPVEAATGSTQGITAEAVTARAPESITGKAIDRATESIAAEAITQTQAEASVSAKAEAPTPEKITAKAVAVSEGKITGEAVSEEGTESVKAESVSERKAPDFTPEQTYQHMLDSLQKGKYAINPYAVEQTQSLRVSAFIERLEEVKAGKSDLMTAFSSDQYSLKEYEKLAKYITDHEPTATEKRMLLRNYLLSKEK